MKKRVLLSIISALLLLLSLSIAASAVEGILVGPEGLPLEGFSNVYVIDGKPQPVYNYAENKWYDVIVVGADENGTPICHVGQSLQDPASDNKEGRENEGFVEKKHCFSGTTLVLMADGSTKRIKDITVGEKVMGYDLTSGQFTSCEVVDNYSTAKTDYYILNGGLMVTTGHPFYATNFGPTPASTRPAAIATIQTQDLKPYATLYGFSAGDSRLEKLTLSSIIHVNGTGTFYDLQVDGTRNFFVSPDGRIFIMTAEKE